MKEDEFNKIVTDVDQKREAMLLKKGSDYDKIEADRLSSFKNVATICNALEVDGHQNWSGSGIATVLLVLKLVRDANMKQSGRPAQNESREDTTIDMHNYIDLKTACEIDEEKVNANHQTES